MKHLKNVIFSRGFWQQLQILSIIGQLDETLAQLMQKYVSQNQQYL